MSFADSLSPIEIKVPEITEDFYSCVESASLIFLETTDDDLIGGVASVYDLDTAIMVLDNTVAQAMYVFDRSGKYLRSIGKKGKAKGEYISFYLFDVSEDDILIVDNLSSRMLCYDINGDFKYDRDRNYHYPCSLCRLQSGCEVCGEHGDQPYLLSIRDSLGNVRCCAFRNYYADVDRLPQLSKSDDGSVLLHYYQCDTIYSVTDSLVYAKYVLNLHKYDTEAFLRRLSVMTKSEQIRTMNSLDSDKCSFLGPFSETDKYLKCDYRIGSQCYFLIFSRASGSVRLFDFCRLNQKSGSTFYLPGASTFFFGDDFLVPADYSSFENMDSKSRETFLGKLDSGDREKFLERIKDPEENPVLCIFHLNF